ncbi:MAG TPA: orotidine-5'-phosphate decarboxylase, partial [Firmicutes bacterium]|nr:orotidine-5'-phosphate decarboxylase [Bacillota bacterium]
KIHDIPNTAAGAAKAAVATGAFMINFHASGGGEMLRTAARAARQEAAKLGIAPPLLIGVTVLTSMSEEDLKGVGVAASPASQVLLLAKLCKDAGLDGVVASPLETPLLRQALGSEFIIVTPGVRPAGESLGDQKRVLAPAQAVQAGSDYLVIGRPITGAEKPDHALREIKMSIGG